MNQFRCFLIAATCLLPMLASAHWQWIDKDGRKVFSDRPPPADIPEKSILTRPNGARVAVPGTSKAATAPAASAPQAAAPALKLIIVDKDLAEKKKQAEEAQAARRNADQERVETARAENCVRARQSKASFDSGRALTRFNENGVPELMNAAARAAEVARIQSVIDADCN